MAKQHNPRFLALVNAARAVIPECNPSELRHMLSDGQPLLVIDVRERHEFEAGHLEGAIHIGKGVLERDIEKQNVADDARVVLYCGGGFRSALAAKAVQDMGWKNVASLWGGWRGIQAEGLPIWQP
ncbi:MAG: sulfurtransferase [Euryarchaeota archaeon]|nr:sulfurtransferase [Euryarchaeota archaeon]|tara:strand:+ start:9932 stop:10309 length:378 start_codon:yes stop_codon:yes gene_type:complete